MKKVKNLYYSDEFQLYGLKWEFMRRNPQYVADYYKYFQRDGKLKQPAKQKEVTKLFLKTYQLFNPLSPELSFFKSLDELFLPQKVSKRRKHWKNILRLEKTNKMSTEEYKIERAKFDESLKDMVEFEDIYNQIKFWASGVYRLNAVNKDLSKGLSADALEAIVKSREGNRKFFIKLLVDGNAPLNNIVEAVKDEIWREQLYNIRLSPVRIRNRVDKLKMYLNVYTLKEETKWTFDRIAKKLYPKEYDEAWGVKDPKVDIESLVKRVNEHYLQAKWYIDGGFREIR